MKNFITIFFILCYAVSNAQNWCPQGAEWTYNYTGLNESGYAKIVYASDTLLNNKNCQKLSVTQVYVQQGFLGGDTLIKVMQPFYTYAHNDTVYFYHGNTFHAVYFFNAQKGDTLQIVNPVYSLNCGSDSIIYLVVDSSDSMQINNETLRFYTAHPLPFYFGQNIAPASITVIEKLGAYTNDSYNGYMFSILPFFSCGLVIEHTYSLRCYKDNNFNLYQTNTSTACDYIITVGINDVQADKYAVDLYPNPSSSSINIRVEHDEIQQISIYNLHGQLQQTNSYSNRSKEVQVGLADFLSGVYFLHLQLSNGGNYVKRIIKQ